MPDAISSMGGSGAGVDRHLWVFLGWLFAFPFSIMHNLDALKYTSGLCFVFIIFVTILVFIYSTGGLDPCVDQELDDDGPCRGDHTLVNNNGVECLKVFSIVVLALTCVPNVFPLLNELERPTVQRFHDLFSYSICTAAVIYIIFAASGYATYGDNIRSDSIINYPINNLDAVARVFISFVVALSYPLQINPARRCMLSVLKSILNGGKEPTLEQVRFRYICITVGYLSFTLFIAMIVSDLGIVLKVVGAAGSSTITFILPSWSYLALFSWKGHEDRRNAVKKNTAFTITLVSASDNDKMEINDKDGYEPLPVHTGSDLYIAAAWVQLIAGIIVIPVCLITIFI